MTPSAVPSRFAEIVEFDTPDPLSVTFMLNATVLLVRYAPALGFITEIAGATFSLTRSFIKLPNVESVLSTTVTFPATSTAFNVIA